MTFLERVFGGNSGLEEILESSSKKWCLPSRPDLQRCVWIKVLETTLVSGAFQNQYRQYLQLGTGLNQLGPDGLRNWRRVDPSN